MLSAAVPQPEGFAWLAQEIFADDYRGTTVTFRGQFRTPEGTGRAGLFLRVMQPQDVRGPVTAEAALADPANHIVTLEGPGDWTTQEVTAPIPDDDEHRRVRRLPGRPRPDRAAQPGAAPGWSWLISYLSSYVWGCLADCIGELPLAFGLPVTDG